MTEPQVLLALALPLLAAGLVLCWAVMLKRRGGFDGLPGRLHGLGVYFDSPRARELALDVAALGSSTVVTLFTISFAVLWLRVGEMRAAVLLSAASLLAGLSGNVLKKLTRRLRPGTTKAVFFGSSFPSSHTLMGSTLYGSAASLFLRDGHWPEGDLLVFGMAVLLSALVGCSRVVLHVHYLSDVAAGWVMAASLVASVTLLAALP